MTADIENEKNAVIILNGLQRILLPTAFCFVQISLVQPHIVAAALKLQYILLHEFSIIAAVADKDK